MRNILKDLAMKNSCLSEDRTKQRNKASEKKKYWLRLTNACNNNCIFCLDNELQNGTCRSLNEIRKELNSGIRGGARKLILSGGEPTMHPEFLEIVSLAKATGYNETQVVTNGRMFCYRDFLENAVKNGITEITFSIHGHTKSLYERQSRVKGSYSQVLTGLSNALRIKRLIVNIDVVINRINYKYLEDILRHFIKLGVGEFDLLQAVPFGNAWENRSKVFYDFKKAMPYLKKAFNLQYEFSDIYIWTNRFPAQYLEGFEELIQHPIKLYDEIRGRKYIFKRFIEKNKIMACYGQRCKYCFLENFCTDLIELKEKRIIFARRHAFCLNSNLEPLARFKSNSKINIVNFLNFYIKHRYFLKSLRCNNCRCCKECDGAPIELIRNKGFRILERINKIGN